MLALNARKRLGFKAAVWLMLVVAPAGCDGMLTSTSRGDGRVDQPDGSLASDATQVGDDATSRLDASDAAAQDGEVTRPLISAPLVVSPTNPRYFLDGNGRTIRLGGHQIHIDLQDHTFNKPTTYGGAAIIDWNWYLDFATERDLNALRNWTLWSTGSGYTDAERIATPMMYERTGPGLAEDGLPKFDVTQFDQAFFDRLYERVSSAQARGIYVTIMLFEVYGFSGGRNAEGRRLFQGNVFYGPNNINGIDVDEDGNGSGHEFFYTDDPAIRALQEAYVRKVIETVGDLDNVLYEVANEVYALDWQWRMIAFIREVESTRAKQHLIYMSPGGRTQTGDWRDMTLAEITSSGADVIGVASAFGSYETDPPVSASGTPAIWDNDHIWGDDWTHRRRAWKAFTRGYHFIFYDHPFERPEETTPDDEIMRRNIGATNRYAGRFADLARMEPRADLSSSGYCLADPGAEYLVYGPTRDPLSVTLAPGTYQVEWYDCLSDAAHDGGTLDTAGGSETLSPPAEVSEDFALYLRRR